MISSKALHNFVNILIIKHDFHKILLFFTLLFFGYINKGDNWISIWLASFFVTLLDADDDNGNDLIPSSVTTTTVVAD